MVPRQDHNANQPQLFFSFEATKKQDWTSSCRAQGEGSRYATDTANLEHQSRSWGANQKGIVSDSAEGGLVTKGTPRVSKKGEKQGCTQPADSSNSKPSGSCLAWFYSVSRMSPHFFRRKRDFLLCQILSNFTSLLPSVPLTEGPCCKIVLVIRGWKLSRYKGKFRGITACMSETPLYFCITLCRSRLQQQQGPAQPLFRLMPYITLCPPPWYRIIESQSGLGWKWPSEII